MKEEENECVMGILNPRTETLDWASVSCNGKFRTHLMICQRGSINLQIPKLLWIFIILGNVHYYHKGCPGNIFFIRINANILCSIKHKQTIVKMSNVHILYMTFLGQYKLDSVKLLSGACQISSNIRIVEMCYTCAQFDTISLKQLSKVSVTNISYNLLFCSKFFIMINGKCLGFDTINDKRNSTLVPLARWASVLAQIFFHFHNVDKVPNKFHFKMQEPHVQLECLPSQHRCPQGQCISMLYYLIMTISVLSILP